VRGQILKTGSGRIFTGAALLVGALAFASFQSRAKEQIVPVRRSTFTEAVYGLGTIKANRVFSLRVGVPSRIRKLYVRAGDEVGQGMPLAEFDEMMPVRAPFSGTISALNFNAEEIVFPQANVMTVVDSKDRYLLVSLEEQGAIRVRKGQRVRASFEGWRRERFLCEAVGLYPEEGQFQMRAHCNDLPPQILPGMTADVLIEVGKRPNVIQIPASALRNGKVKLIRGSNDLEVGVSLGAIEGGWAEVASGDVREGDRVRVPEEAK
jgi:multidrug efflux pump subunit AcrA (membrane-fusion protein)